MMLSVPIAAFSTSLASASPMAGAGLIGNTGALLSGAVSTFPYNQGFESGPSGAVIHEANWGSNQWCYKTTRRSGNFSAGAAITTTGDDTRRLFVYVNFSGKACTSISYWYKITSVDTTVRMMRLIGSNDGGNTWFVLNNWTNISNATSWTQFSANQNLAKFNNQSNCYIKIQVKNMSGHNQRTLYVDDFCVTANPWSLIKNITVPGTVYHSYPYIPITIEANETMDYIYIYFYTIGKIYEFYPNSSTWSATLQIPLVREGTYPYEIYAEGISGSGQYVEKSIFVDDDVKPVLDQNNSHVGWHSNNGIYVDVHAVLNEPVVACNWYLTGPSGFYRSGSFSINPEASVVDRSIYIEPLPGGGYPSGRPYIFHAQFEDRGYNWSDWTGVTLN
jgi:hypothetical protein